MLLVVHSLAEAAIPVLIGATIDEAVLPSDPLALAMWLGILAAVFLVLTASYQGASRMMVSIYGHGEQALRHLALSQLLRPRLSRLTLTPGEALTYVTSDTYRFAGVAWSVAQQCATIAAIAGAGIAMWVISPIATAVVFASTVVMLVVMHIVSRPLERRGMIEQRAATEAGAVAADFMSGFRVLVGMSARGEAVRRYVAASDSSRIAATAAGRSLAGYEAVSAVLAAITTTVLAGMSAWFAAEGQISVGELITVLGLAQFLSGSLAYAGSFPSNWIHKVASARRLADLIDADDLLAPPAEARSAEGTPPKLAPETVLSFRSGPDAPLIAVARGELVGIRPPDSDAARQLSDLLGLRVRLKRGMLTVAIDGVAHDASDLDPVAYRRHVASLPHRHTVMTGTLRHAVRGPRAGEDPRPALVDIAALHDTVAEIGGWDAEVGEAGRRLSGGQRQRIGIARVLHAEADIVVLDEPTSAVDAITEAHIAGALARQSADRGATTIVITTSPILLDACDRVVDLASHAAGVRCG